MIDLVDIDDLTGLNRAFSLEIALLHDNFSNTISNSSRDGERLRNSHSPAGSGAEKNGIDVGFCGAIRIGLQDIGRRPREGTSISYGRGHTRGRHKSPSRDSPSRPESCARPEKLQLILRSRNRQDRFYRQSPTTPQSALQRKPHTHPILRFPKLAGWSHDNRLGKS